MDGHALAGARWLRAGRFSTSTGVNDVNDGHLSATIAQAVDVFSTTLDG